jgi:hypothetical protein
MVMFDSPSATLAPLSSLHAVDLDIGHAESLIAETIQRTIVALRKGEDTTALEQRIQLMRQGLALLNAQRKAIVRAAHQP